MVSIAEVISLEDRLTTARGQLLMLPKQLAPSFEAVDEGRAVAILAAEIEAVVAGVTAGNLVEEER